VHDAGSVAVVEIVVVDMNEVHCCYCCWRKRKKRRSKIMARWSRDQDPLLVWPMRYE
jgi:hypothetical protein